MPPKPTHLDEIDPRTWTLVCARPCNECLYSDARIVPADRAEAIDRDTVRHDKHFICHKASLHTPPLQVACHGHYTRHPDTQIYRVGIALDRILGIDLETGALSPLPYPKPSRS
jgi:hypothetical protein